MALTEHYYLPGDLEAEIATFVAHYNTRRYRENLRTSAIGRGLNVSSWRMS